MKKLLFLLLIPFISYSQSAFLSHSYIDPTPFVVGDTITVKFEGILMQSTPDYAMFDFQWNNKLLEKISHEFNPTSADGWDTNTETTWYQWTGYKFNPNPSVNVIVLNDQYNWWANGASNAGTSSYNTSADWSVGRVVMQGVSTLVSDTAWVYVKFKIKDRQGTSYTDYSNVTNLNWGRFEDISDASGIYDIRSGNHSISIADEDISGVGAGTVTIQLNTPATADHATDFGYSLYTSSQLGENGFPNPNEVPFASGTFDDNGQAQFTNLVIGETYWIHTHVITTQTTLQDGTTVNGPAWLDEVLTVTDAYLIFQEAIGAGDTPNGTSTKFTYQIQYEIGEVDNSGNVDFKDSYVALAHISGVDPGSTWFTSTSNGPFNLSGMTDTFGVASNEYYFGLKHVFTISEDISTYNVAHAFKGDPDFSHSYVPTAEGAGTGVAPQATLSKSKSLTINSMKEAILTNLDIVSYIENGRVIVDIKTSEPGLVGTQFTIKYDSTILNLQEARFDKGNEMSNFANHKPERSTIFVGSLDQDGSTAIKTGTPYKLIFTPNQTISNTAGLISFDFNEGVKANGTKVKFIIQ